MNQEARHGREAALHEVSQRWLGMAMAYYCECSQEIVDGILALDLQSDDEPEQDEDGGYYQT